MKTPGTATHYGQAGGHRRGSLGSDTSPDSRIYIPSITSQEILDENSQSRHNPRSHHHGARRGGVNRKGLVFLLLVVVAAVGAVVAFVVTSGSASSSGASNSSGGGNESGNSTTTKAPSSGASESDTTGGGTTTSSGDGDSTGKDVMGTVKSDPKTGEYPLSMFAIGDWGQTDYTNGSCCTRRKGIYNGYDWHAELGVTKLMDMQAQTQKPKVVIGHGDSFYWTGINGEKDKAYRFDLTFEQRHKTESMMEVPWINVMGNHDYGGGSYICMDGEEKLVECNNAEELLAALQKKFELQSTYTSPNSDRWVLKDHFYVYTVKQDDISVDVFNLDMNDAESHGANEICCQCYSYTGGSDKLCKGVTRGGENCLKGDTAMYDACVGQFNKWSEESLESMVAEVKKSKATWKIVNSHYSPYGHYGEPSGKKWLQALADLGDVHVWIAGHTHGEKHDYSTSGTHFIENGAGGGIQSESASGIPPWATGISNLWTAGGLGGDGGNAYGFFTLDASADWLKVRYMTFDDNWSLTKDGSSLADSKIGGVATKWCYYIPVDGAKGQAC